MLDLEVIDEPAAAIAALDPVRSQILRVLAEPGSATTVAEAIGLPRQKVNYHLRTLEEHGLVALVATRPRRGLTERVMLAGARRFVVSPDALGAASREPEPLRADRLSTRYLVALAARMVTEVTALARRAEQTGRTLPTLAIDTEIRFASAADRAAFTDELTRAVTGLTAKYHDERAAGGRWHRLVVAAHPRAAAAARPPTPPAPPPASPPGAPPTPPAPPIPPTREEF